MNGWKGCKMMLELCHSVLASHRTSVGKGRKYLDASVVCRGKARARVKVNTIWVYMDSSGIIKYNALDVCVHSLCE